MTTLPLRTKVDPQTVLRATLPLVGRGALLLPALLHWRQQRQQHLSPGARLLRQLQARPMMAVGATALGALAVGAFSVGALAIGALAIGKLALGKAEIKQMHIRSLQVDTLSLPSVAT